MTELLRLHWRFLRNPSACLEQYITIWPIKYGIAVYVFYAVSGLLLNDRAHKMWDNALLAIFNISDPQLGYLIFAATVAIGVLFQYWVMPAVAARISPAERGLFDAEQYRRLVFYSPIASVIFSIVVLLPLQLAASIIAASGLGLLGVVLALVLTLVSLWSLPLMVNAIVVHWKGLERFFGFSTYQIILLIFIIPLVLALPLILVFGSKYLEFASEYAR